MHKTPPTTPLKETRTNEELMHQCMSQLKINRKGEAALIGLLSEIDNRRLFAAEGYSSMFKFCTGHLHLSEPATYRRIGAARVIRDYPIALEMLSEGEIHMTALNLIRPCLTSENHLELLRLCKHKTRMEVELLVTERFPERAKYQKKRNSKAEIRALPSLALDNLACENPQRELSPTPAKESAQSKKNAYAQNPLWQELRGQKECEQHGSKREKTPDHKLPISRQFRLSLDIDHTLQKKLTHAQELSHFGKSSIQDVLSASLDLFIKDRMKVKFKKRSSPANAHAATQTAKSTKPKKTTTKAKRRYISSPIKREVAARDNFQCTYTSKSGHRCCEKQGLEYHHLQAFSLRGAHTAQNLTLLCSLHNQFDAEQTLGAQVMEKWRGV